MEKVGNKSIQNLNLSDNTRQILKENKIKSLIQLSKMSKTDLKNFGLLSHEVNKIEVELELVGMQLKGSL